MTTHTRYFALVPSAPCTVACRTLPLPTSPVDINWSVYCIDLCPVPQLSRLPAHVPDVLFHALLKMPILAQFAILPLLPATSSTSSTSLTNPETHGIEIADSFTPVKIKWYKLATHDGGNCLWIMLNTGAVIPLWVAGPRADLGRLAENLSDTILTLRPPATINTTTIAVTCDAPFPLPSPPPSTDLDSRQTDAFRFTSLIYSLTRDARFYHAARVSLLSNTSAFKKVVTSATASRPKQPPLSAPSLLLAAHHVLPALLAITRKLAGALSLATVGVGPLKTLPRAREKASRKYAGDVSLILDYARTLIVVDSVAQLVTAVELVKAKCKSAVVRIKLDSLVGEKLPGGFRHAIVNVALPNPMGNESHVCQIQIVTKSFYAVCESSGARHHIHCVQTSAHTLASPHLVLHNLKLVDAAKILGHIQRAYAAGFASEQEKCIRIVEAGLLMHLGYFSWALFNVNALISARRDLPDHHEEVRFLQCTRKEILAHSGGADKAGKVVAEYGDEKVNVIFPTAQKRIRVAEVFELCKEAAEAPAGDSWAAAFLRDGEKWWTQHCEGDGFTYLLK